MTKQIVVISFIRLTPQKMQRKKGKPELKPKEEKHMREQTQKKGSVAEKDSIEQRGSL